VLCEVMLGLKVNLSKRVFIPVGEVTELTHLAHIFSCGVDDLPSSYHSLPLGTTYKSKAI